MTRKLSRNAGPFWTVVAVAARHRFPRSGLAELAPPNAQTCASAHSKKLPMAGGSEGGFGRPLLAANGPSFSCISYASWAKGRGQRAAKKWQRSDSAPKLNMLGLLHA